MDFTLNRRQALAAGAGAIAAAAFGAVAAQAQAAAKNDIQEVIAKFTGGKKPVEKLVRLDLPEIAENGNTVPIGITVESPMTEQSYVKDLLVVADGNPRAAVATFHFTPNSGVAEVSTRIRLIATQHVTAIARMNDGSLAMGTKEVKVTIGGCGG